MPEFAHLADVVRVVDVREATGGKILRVLMNAELDEALAVFSADGQAGPSTGSVVNQVDAGPEEHWRWRCHMAEHVARLIDAEYLGVKALYVFGSTKNATAGPGSDIDLIVHVDDDTRRKELALWLDGWSQALAQMNYLRTGYRSGGLLDVHYVTDADIEAQTSWAAKIDAVTDPARKLPLGGNANSD